MLKVLTKQQIEQYHDEGFISPIKVISETEALSIKSQLEEVEAQFPEEINAESRNNLHLSFEFLDALAHNSIIVDAMEDLIGPNIALWATVMFAVAMLTFWIGYRFAFVSWNWLSSTVAVVCSAGVALLPADELRSLLADGVVAGVGGMLIFLPQICILFFFLSLLEDSGYMARAAFVMERLMRRVGLI